MEPRLNGQTTYTLQSVCAWHLEIFEKINKKNRIQVYNAHSYMVFA